MRSAQSSWKPERSSKKVIQIAQSRETAIVTSDNIHLRIPSAFHEPPFTIAVTEVGHADDMYRSAWYGMRSYSGDPFTLPTRLHCRQERRQRRCSVMKSRLASANQNAECLPHSRTISKLRGLSSLLQLQIMKHISLAEVGLLVIMHVRGQQSLLNLRKELQFLAVDVCRRIGMKGLSSAAGYGYLQLLETTCDSTTRP